MSPQDPPAGGGRVSIVTQTRVRVEFNDAFARWQADTSKVIQSFPGFIEQTVIPPNSLVAGVPGKIRRTLGDEDRALILKYAQNYLDYTAIYLREASSP